MMIKRVLLMMTLCLPAVLTCQQPAAVTAREIVDAVMSDLKPGTKLLPLSRMSSAVMKSSTIGFQSEEMVSIESWLLVNNKRQQIIINVWLENRTRIIKLVEIPLSGASLTDLRNMGFKVNKSSWQTVTCVDGRRLLIKKENGNDTLLMDQEKGVRFLEMFPGYGYNITVLGRRAFALTLSELEKCSGKNKKQ